MTEFALEAVERAGMKPVLNIIRGGTDGARLSYEGLLTPNIFTGEQAKTFINLTTTHRFTVLVFGHAELLSRCGYIPSLQAGHRCWS